MATNIYSLNDYSIVFNFKSEVFPNSSLSIGGYGDNGEGSFLGEIKVGRSKDLWTTNGEASGSWVHERSYDRTGTVSLSIRQISDDVLRLMGYLSKFDRSGDDAFRNEDIAISSILIKKGNTIIAECESCYPTRIPEQVFGETSQQQNWMFGCGKIIFLPPEQ